MLDFWLMEVLAVRSEVNSECGLEGQIMKGRLLDTVPFLPVFTIQLRLQQMKYKICFFEFIL